MLFYDGNDDICIKINKFKYKRLINGDIINKDNKNYFYQDFYFYPSIVINGTTVTDRSSPIHQRHMDIKEMFEVYSDFNEVFNAKGVTDFENK